MNFLELVQELHTQSGAAGTRPSSVTNQTGEAARLVSWIASADYRLQTRWNDWKFLRSTFTTGNTTTAGNATLAKPADLKTWDFDTFRILWPGETEYFPIQVVEYFSIKDEILTTEQDAPSRIIIMPNNDLRFDPVPDGVYTVRADYYRRPTRLAANADISAVPEEYHESVILGLALQYYGAYENAPEIMDAAALRLEAMANLETDQRYSAMNAPHRNGARIEVVAGNDHYDY